MKKCVLIPLTCAALIIAGYGFGLSTHVAVVRGVPTVSPGGEALLLLSIPSAFFIGNSWGRGYQQRKEAKKGGRPHE